MPHLYQTVDKKTGKPHPRWRFQYRDYLGRKRTRTGTTSRHETAKMAVQVQARQQLIRNNVVAAPKASDKVWNIDEIITQYMEWGMTQGGRRGHPWGPEHARKRAQDLAFWKAELRLKTQIDLIECQPRVERVIHRLRVTTGRSGKTTWNRVETLAALGRWCVDRDYLVEDPLRRLRKINTDPVSRRRPLTTQEIDKLLEACLQERRLLYETAICTGLRANELRHITPAHLDADGCGIRLEGGWTKNRQDGFQPVPRWLMDKLLGAVDALKPSVPVFAVQKTHPARMIRTDLERAGIPFEIPGEGKVDFHSLRMTYCSLLDEVGASAKEAQQLARHSTPTLTMNLYVKTRTNRVRRTVDALGALLNPAAPQLCPNEEPPNLHLLRNAG